MKPKIFFAPAVFLLFFIFSCEREMLDRPDTGVPRPADSTLQRNFRVVFDNMSAYQNVSGNLTVNLTVEDAQAKGYNLSVPLVFDKKYATSVIRLPKGTYTIRKLVITDGTAAAQFATPLAGSLKAGLVARPLAVPLILDEKADKDIDVEVLQVTGGDKPESFGYTEGSFGNRPQTPEADKRIFIRPLIRIGEVVYDSIPVQLIVKSWDVKNEMTYNVHYLSAGTQSIYLSGKAVKYHLSISKWGIYDEMILSREEVQENNVYDLGGSKAARKLMTVYESKVLNGTATPLTKTDYEYYPDGRVKQKQVLGKRADMSNYVVQKDIYEHTHGRITAIRSYDENDALIKTTSVDYDDKGQIIGMEENKGGELIRAKIHYSPLETRSGLRQDYRIEIQYSYGNGEEKGYYSKTIRGGSVLADKFVRNAGMEEGSYTFDFAINPYVHLNIPDLWLTSVPAHNMSFQRKIWTGAHPENVADAFEYTYDSEGYPKELLTRYKSYKTRADTYAIRTVFVYHP